MKDVAVTQRHYGNPEFWKRFALTDEDALAIAKYFPIFWESQNERLKDFPIIDYDSREAERDALTWAHGGDGLPAASRYLPTGVVSGRYRAYTLYNHAAEYRRQIEHDADEVIGQKITEYRTGLTELDDPIPIKPLPSEDWPPYTDDGAQLVNGDFLAEQHILARIVNSRTARAGLYLRWGPLLLPYDRARNSHFCVVGMPRSGKTVLFGLLLQSLYESVLRDQHKRHRQMPFRVVAYDKKTDFYPVIKEIACAAVSLNPFDRRSHAWDIASDADSMHQAHEIARLFLPDSPHEKPYFTEAPRALLAAAIVSLRAVRGRFWNLMDLLIACKPTNIRDVLSSCSYGRDAIATHLSAPHGTSTDILSTLATKLTPLYPIAAAWDHAEHFISIRDWAANSSECLVLGDSDKHAYAMRALNQVLLQLISDSLLDNEMERSCDTFLFLDELQNLGRIEMLPSLLSTGASLGVTAVLGLHDLTALDNVYSEDTEGLLGFCGHYAFLRVNARKTAEWASAKFGIQEVRFDRKSSSRSSEGDGPNRNAETTTPQFVRRHVVTADEILSLPLTDTEQGLNGYFTSVLHPPYRGHLDGNCLFVGCLNDERRDECIPEGFDADGSPIGLGTTYTLRQPSTQIERFEPRSKEELEPRNSFRRLIYNDELVDMLKQELVPPHLNASGSDIYIRMEEDAEEILRCRPDGEDLVEFPQDHSPILYCYSQLPSSPNQLPGTGSDVRRTGENDHPSPGTPHISSSHIRPSTSHSDQGPEQPESKSTPDVADEILKIRRPKIS